MSEIKIYFLLSIVINFSMVCNGYVVGQFDGEFINGMNLDINIHFVGALDKYLMQAIDSKQNMLSFKTSKTDIYKLIVDFNGLTSNMNTWRHILFPEILVFSMEFVFKENNLYYRYGYSKDQFKLLFSKIASNSIINKKLDSTLDWPSPGDIFKMNYQTKIWFGYSNQMRNNYNFDSDWSTNPVIGCIFLFAANNKPIKLEMNGNHFYNNCSWKNITEEICENENCEVESNYDRNVVDCKDSLSGMNTAKHCYRDLSNKIDLQHSYERTRGYSKSIIVKLAWKAEQSTNQCLLEIVTREFSLIEIYLNSTNHITLAIKHVDSINWSKYFLYEISPNQIHILKIEFTYANSIFKVSNDSFIRTLILPELGSIKLINVGWNFATDFCQQLRKNFVFRYDLKEFISLNESYTSIFLMKAFKKVAQKLKETSTRNLSPIKHAFYQTTDSLSNSRKNVKQETKVHNWIILFIMITSVSINILIGIILIIRKIKRQKENIPRSTLNIYEEPLRMNNLEHSENAVNEERIGYIHDE